VARIFAIVRSSVARGTKVEMSPPSRAISFTRREAMNWFVSDAMRNSVSIS